MKKNTGFSLMEVLVAMVLLATVGGLTMFSFTNSTQATQPSASVAYNYGRGLMEEMYERVRQDHWTDPGLPLSLVNPAQFPVRALNGKTYTPSYTSTKGDLNGDGVEDFRKVKMTVSW